MNYSIIYENFILDRMEKQDFVGYGEKHHIVPRSLGGTDDKENIIRLAGSDHFFAHRLLAKIHGGKMLQAINIMINQYNTLNRFSFGHFREEYAKYMREFHSGENNSFYGKTHDKETRLKIGRNQKGTNNANYGKKHIFSEQAKINMSNAHKGNKHSEETKKKMSEWQRGKKKPKVKCPYCGLIGSNSNMKRYHFEKCKKIA